MGIFSSFKEHLETKDGAAESIIRASGMGCGISTVLILLGMAAGPIGAGVAVAGAIGVIVNGGLLCYSAYKAFERTGSEKDESVKLVELPSDSASGKFSPGNWLKQQFSILPSAKAEQRGNAYSGPKLPGA